MKRKRKPTYIVIRNGEHVLVTKNRNEAEAEKSRLEKWYAEQGSGWGVNKPHISIYTRS